MGVLDPRIAELLDELERSDATPVTGGTVQDARRRYRELVLGRRGDAAPEPVGDVADTTVPGPGGPVPVRVYTPPDPIGAVVWAHGGGWVAGDLDTHDSLCRHVTNEVGAVVVSVGYRLAPEHPFPAGLDDVVAVLHWAHARWRGLPLAVAGDSAGANIAGAAALRARDEGPPLRAQLLLYPTIDTTSGGHAASNRRGFPTAADLRWFLDQYLPVVDGRHHPHADLLTTPNLARLPPAVLALAEFDVLREEGKAYADRLRAAGVTVACLPGNGMVHGYFGMADRVESARLQRQDVLDTFAALLAR